MERRGRALRSRPDELSEDHRGDGSSVDKENPFQSLPSIPLTASQRSSNTKTSSRAHTSKSKSPSKKGVKDVGQAVSNAAVDLPFLAQCKPNLQPASYADLIAANQVPENVKALYWKLKDIPAGVIPRELKVRC